jgi:hypothetical protein
MTPILSHISHKCVLRTSNNLPTALGFYMHGGGVEARTIDLCHKVGDFEGVLRVRKEVSKVHQEIIKRHRLNSCQRHRSCASHTRRVKRQLNTCRLRMTFDVSLDEKTGTLFNSHRLLFSYLLLKHSINVIFSLNMCHEPCKFLHFVHK